LRHLDSSAELDSVQFFYVTLRKITRCDNDAKNNSKQHYANLTMRKTNQNITRKEAIQKLGNYGKYTALTALGTYMILSPKKAQASSQPDIDPPGSGF